MNLSNIDLNLFAVLYAVISERSVTKAATALHVTQSAVSNSLARLREVFDDPLVVRSGRGLVLTPRAEALAPMVLAGLNNLDTALNGPRRFVPRETTRTFALAAADNQQVCDVPQIAERFSRLMPRAKLRIVSPDYFLASDGLATGEIDAVLGPKESAKPPYFSKAAMEEFGAVVVRRNHPSVKAGVSKQLYNSLTHIDVEVALGRPGVGHHVAQQSWQRQGITREIALSVPNFTAAALAASRTNHVATIPDRMAKLFCKMLPLKIVQPEFAMPSIRMALIWHARTNSDEGSALFREVVLRVLSIHSPR